MKSTPPGNDGVRLVFRWWVIIIVALLGVACIVGPFFYDPFGSWQTITSSTLTNVGTTMTFAAVLFLLERAFVRRVAVQARTQAEQVLTAATSDLRAENEELAARLSDLNDLLQGADVRRERTREKAVEALENNVSFDTVTRLMETANDLNALPSGRIIVPAGRELDSPRLSFFWGSARAPSSNVFEEPALELRLRDDRGGVVRFGWTEQMSVTEAARELDRVARTQGCIAEADAIDFQVLLTNFKNAVDTAISGRSSSTAWPDGRIAEWVADGWAITDEGVEVEEHGVLVAEKDFPYYEVMGSRKVPTSGYERPDQVDEELWNLTIDLMKRHHTSTIGGSSGIYGPYPYNSANTPRKPERVGSPLAD